jgi:hypothetical protein
LEVRHHAVAEEVRSHASRMERSRVLLRFAPRIAVPSSPTTSRHACVCDGPPG